MSDSNATSAYEAEEARPSGAPWRSSVAAWLDRVGKDRAALFGVAMTLDRSPHKVRTDGFEAGLSAWWRESLAHERRGGLRPGPRPSADHKVGSPAQASRLRHTTPDALSSGLDSQRRIDDQREPQERPSHERSLEAAGALAISPVDGQDSKPSDHASLHDQSAVSLTDEGRKDGGKGSRPETIESYAGTEGSDVIEDFSRHSEQAADEQSATAIDETDRTGRAIAAPIAASEGEDPWNSELGCATNLGGLLYLHNAMKRLEIPECFEADWGLETALGPWGCLQALGIGLLAFSLNRSQPALQNDEVWFDPMWRVLKELEGREADQPLGAGVVDPGTFVAPKAWASLFGRELVSERPADAAANLEVPISITTPVLRWATLAAPYLAEYIRVAAGPLASPDFDPAALLYVRGRIYATKTHVDLVADLDQISLAARVAGLDANPGWDPRFGRVVQFHFR